MPDGLGTGELLPVGLTHVGRHLFVQLIDPVRLDLDRPFFREAVPARRSADKFLPVQDWVASCEASQHTSFTSTAGIFHTARCGSTLLAANLRRTRQCVVLSEPGFLVRSLQMHRGALGSELGREFLTAAVAAWQCHAARDHRRLVIKFNSLAHRWASEIIEQLPGARLLFLYREPVAVLESLTRRPPAYLASAGTGLAQEKPDRGAVATDDPAGLAGLHYCSVLRSFTGRTVPTLRFVDFADLQGRFGAILSHFELEERWSEVWDDCHDAKEREVERLAYVPVSVDRLAEFVDQHGQAVAAARSCYDAFRSQLRDESVIR